MKYLMVQTTDRRKFLTSSKNLTALEQFCKDVGAELCTVEIKSRMRLLSLEELAEAICNPHYKAESFEYKVVSTKAQNKTAANKREKGIRMAAKLLGKGKTVNVPAFCKKMNMTAQMVRSCVRQAAKLLNAKVVLLSPGEYRRA